MSPARSAHSGARPGMTMLEVVLAVVLLSMVATTFVTAHSYVYKAGGREAQRLGAAELANRVMLQFLDDKNLLPSRNSLLDYNQLRYRWTLEEVPVQLRLDPAAAENEAQRSSGLGLDRIRMIIVRVWLSEESGGASLYTDRVPSITITRLFDPIGFENRSPDSFERKFENEEGRREFLDELLQLMGGTQSGSTTGTNNGSGAGAGGAPGGAP